MDNIENLLDDLVTASFGDLEEYKKKLKETVEELEKAEKE